MISALFNLEFYWIVLRSRIVDVNHIYLCDHINARKPRFLVHSIMIQLLLDNGLWIILDYLLKLLMKRSHSFLKLCHRNSFVPKYRIWNMYCKYTPFMYHKLNLKSYINRQINKEFCQMDGDTNTMQVHRC